MTYNTQFLSIYSPFKKQKQKQHTQNLMGLWFVNIINFFPYFSIMQKPIRKEIISNSFNFFFKKAGNQMKM
jgi:hypothetical protein